MADKKKVIKPVTKKMATKKKPAKAGKKPSQPKKSATVKAVKVSVKGKKPASKTAQKTTPKTVAKTVVKKVPVPVNKKKPTTTKTRPVKTQIKKKPASKSAAQQSAMEETLKKKLIQDREGIIKEAKSEIARYIKGETRQIVESGMDDGDWSVLDLSEDVNFKRLAAHRERLIKIDAALGKLREGTYWICEDCGEPINVERLKVMPFAIYCKDCQEKREELDKIGSEDEL